MGYRGKKHHLKRVHAPHQWCLKKMGGNFAPRPSSGPHKLRECLPMALLLRNKLKYALTYNEVKLIVMQRTIKIDGKVRTDVTYPIGFQDVITIEKTNEYFRMLYDTKGRFVIHRIKDNEAKFKLCRIRRVFVGPKGIPYAITHDGRTLRYVHPNIRPHDTVIFDLENSKVVYREGAEWLRFEEGKMVMITGGSNIGRIGTVMQRERHPGAVEVVHVKDSRGQMFATKVTNCFVIGTGEQALISLPKNAGIKFTIVEEQNKLLAKKRQVPVAE